MRLASPGLRIAQRAFFVNHTLEHADHFSPASTAAFHLSQFFPAVRAWRARYPLGFTLNHSPIVRQAGDCACRSLYDHVPTFGVNVIDLNAIPYSFV